MSGTAGEVTRTIGVVLALPPSSEWARDAGLAASSVATWAARAWPAAAPATGRVRRRSSIHP